MATRKNTVSVNGTGSWKPPPQTRETSMCMEVSWETCDLRWSLRVVQVNLGTDVGRCEVLAQRIPDQDPAGGPVGHERAELDLNPYEANVVDGDRVLAVLPVRELDRRYP